MTTAWPSRSIMAMVRLQLPVVAEHHQQKLIQTTSTSPLLHFILETVAVETGISFNALSGSAFRKVVDVLNKQSRANVKVLSGHAIAEHVTASAEELMKEVTEIIRSCRAWVF